MRAWTLVALLAALLAADAAGQTPKSAGARGSAPAWKIAAAREESLAVRRGIDAGNAAYLDAFRRGDARALAGVYDPDAAQMRPGGQVIRGRAAIAANLASLLRRIRFINGSITSSSLWRVDDLVYDVGHYAFVFQPEGRDTLVERSRYLNVWRRQADGSWKIWRDLPVPRE
jgi:uncharacterized protein (TIGR02246 family)